MSSMEPDPDDSVSSLDSSLDSSPQPQPNTSPVKPQSKLSLLNNKRLRLIGLAVIGLAIIIGGIYSFGHSKKPGSTIIINTQNLDAGTLSKLKGQNTTATIAQLTITPNTLFKNNADVQGNLSVGGQTHLQGAVSAGSSLSAAGNFTVGGSANIGGNLSVSGLLTVRSLSVGSLTITTLHTTGDLDFGGHLVSTGNTPSGQAGISAGSGAKVVVSGDDTSGTVTITTGSGATAGELAQITFATAFKLAPRVQLTPLNSDSATVQYYVGPAANTFTINSAATAKSGTIYSFDYLVSQ